MIVALCTSTAFGQSLELKQGDHISTVGNTLADRMQQGYVNFMYLGRALIHPDGLGTDAAFAMDATHERVPCASCHESSAFRPLATDCAGCHTAEAAALEGRSIKDYVLERAVGDAGEGDALGELAALLRPRIEAADRGDMSSRSVQDIAKLARAKRKA